MTIKLPFNLADELGRRRFLARLRWPNGLKCSCGSKRLWELSSGNLRCNDCKRNISVTAGTLFADSHQPLELWFKAIWHLITHKYGTSAMALQRELRLGSYHT